MKIKLGDLRPGAVFETKDGKRFVKSKFTDKAKAKGQWQCVSLEDGSHPGPFPEVNAEEVTALPYFDAGGVITVDSLEPGDLFETVPVLQQGDGSVAMEAPFAGQRFFFAHLFVRGNDQIKAYVSTKDGAAVTLPPDLKVRVLRQGHDPKVTAAQSQLLDLQDSHKVLRDKVQATLDRMEQACGPLGLINPNEAGELLQILVEDLAAALFKDGS